MTRIIEDTKLDYSDVLLVPQISDINSRSEISLTSDHFEYGDSIPIIAANMDRVGTFRMAEALAKHKLYTCLVKHYSVEDLVRFYTDTANVDIIPYTIYSMGTNQEDIKKFKTVIDQIEAHEGSLEAQSAPQIVCIDVANGYSKSLLDFIYHFRNVYPNKTLIVGNVCTPTITYDLIRYGADYVKIGIGPGSVCTTRIVTGTGYPQFSAVMECAEAALRANGAIIADGGCTSPGDVAKAFGAGAVGVMLGGMFAGHDEGYDPKELGQIWNPDRNRYEQYYDIKKLPFYGMASKKAQELHNDGLKDYRSSEGREVSIPYRGPVENTVLHLLGGLRSALSYTGARNLTEFSEKAKFCRVNHQYNRIFE